MGLNASDPSITVYPTSGNPAEPSFQSYFVGNGEDAIESMVFLAHTVPSGETVTFTIYLMTSGEHINGLQAEVIPYPM